MQGQGAGYRDLSAVEQRHDVPAVLLRGAGGKAASRSWVTVNSALTMSSGSRSLASISALQELVRRRQDLARVVPGDRGGAANALHPGAGSIMADNVSGDGSADARHR